jgi:hypothetical protein
MDQHHRRPQGIEQKMGLELHPQHVQLRLCQACLKLCRLDLALSRLVIHAVNCTAATNAQYVSRLSCVCWLK